MSLTDGGGCIRLDIASLEVRRSGNNDHGSVAFSSGSTPTWNDPESIPATVLNGCPLIDPSRGTSSPHAIDAQSMHLQVAHSGQRRAGDSDSDSDTVTTVQCEPYPPDRPKVNQAVSLAWK